VADVVRRLLVISTWVAGTVLATVVAFQAVSVVGRDVSDAGQTLSRQEVAQLATSSTTAPSADSTDTSLSPTTAVTVPPAPGPSQPSSSTGPGSGATATTRRGDPTPTVSPPTTASGPASTFHLQGGNVSAGCSGTSIQLLSASPNSGYSVDVNKSGPDEIDVRFESTDHRSELRANCQTGHVTVTEQREDAEGKDG
jgi:hypothetical protein